MNPRHGIRLSIALFVLAPATHADDLGGHMQAQYDAIVRIQSAVIAGSLDATREPAEWLVSKPSPAGLPDGAEAYMDEMRAAASQLLEAGDLSAAAGATARLGMSCGSCHLANDAAVDFETPARPSNKEKTGPHMDRHQWAADRMWEGLVGPSDPAWSRGGNILFEAPLRGKAIGNDDATVQMARRIHQLAANATTVSELSEKAEIYGEFLANCAASHQTLGDGPKR